MSTRRKTHEQFLADMAFRGDPGIEILGEYGGSFAPILVRCRKCGRQWETKPNILLGGSGCGECKKSARMKTPEQFAEEMQAKGNPNVIVVGEYVDSKTPLKCRCRKCGREWTSKPGNLLSGRGCRECGKELIGASLRMSHEDFMAKLAEVGNPDIEVIGRYFNQKTKVHVRCRSCGREWDAAPSSLLNGGGCSVCSAKRAGLARRMTTEEFAIRLSEEGAPEVELIGEYVDWNTRVTVRCRKCGRVWDSAPSNLLSGNGCRRCVGTLAKTHEQFLRDMEEKGDPCVEILGEYVTAKKKIACRCRECGHEWFATPDSLLRGNGCKRCSSKRGGAKLVMPESEFVRALAASPSPTELAGGYVNASTKALFRCTKCGHEWMAIPSAILKGHGCPECSHMSTSIMEQFIYQTMLRIPSVGKVLHRNRAAIGMELDILLPDLKLAFEPGSWFWHKSKRKSDLSRIERCEEGGIRLVIIFDQCSLNEPPYPDCYIFPTALNTGDGLGCLKRVMGEVLADYGISLNEQGIDWNEVETEARLKARKTNTKEFARELAKVNKDIEVVGEYLGSAVKIACRCRVCGNEWSAVPSSLKAGCGCPRCGTERAAEKRRKTHEEFLSDLEGVRNPNVEILGMYINSSTPISCRCKDCGFEWETLPGSLLSGHGCDKCAHLVAAEKRSRSNEDYVFELAEANPGIEPIEEYAGVTTKVLVRCRKCGCEWKATPNALINQGYGCPECLKSTLREMKLKTHGQYMAEFAESGNPDVEILGEYVGGNKRIKARCKICGREWEPYANSLLRGTGCRRCASRMSQAEFEARLFERNPDIEVLGEYKGSREKVEVRCRNCGREWEDSACHLMNGRGCSRCSKLAEGQDSLF